MTQASFIINHTVYLYYFPPPPPPPSHSLVPKNLGLFHIKHPVPLVLQDQIVQSRRMNMQKKLNQALTIIKITKIIV